MKKSLFVTGILACMLVFGTGTALAQTVSLDSAIKSVVDEFSYNFKRGSKVAVLAVRSDSARMSSYIIEELTSSLVSQRLVTVVDRAQLDLIQQEMKFQTSGEVSDSSAQAIGRKLGAQAIITGSFEPVGNYYRFRVRAIEVETAAIQVTYSANVQNDQTVASLMGGANNSAPGAPVAAWTPQPDYLDFTTGQRWGTWALNAFTIPGIGSYVIMKDWVGGTIQLGVGIAGQIVWWVNVANLYNYLFADIGDVDAVEYIVSTSVGLGIGALLNLGVGIFNIVRSSSYHKPQPTTASLIDPTAWNIAVLPGENGIEKVQVLYTLKF